MHHCYRQSLYCHSNGVYEKISGAGWNADVASSKGFVNDGYVIAK
jgi:hypothetical protein